MSKDNKRRLPNRIEYGGAVKEKVIAGVNYCCYRVKWSHSTAYRFEMISRTPRTGLKLRCPDQVQFDRRQAWSFSDYEDALRKLESLDNVLEINEDLI